MGCPLDAHTFPQPAAGFLLCALDCASSPPTLVGIQIPLHNHCQRALLVTMANHKQRLQHWSMSL
jgi:hypothetical protein